MANKLRYVISEEDSGNKLVHFLKTKVKMSSRFTRKMARENLATINGKRAINSEVLNIGDIVEINLDAGDTQNIQSEDINIDIAYEDNDLLVVNKPPFMVVHPTKSYQSGTLANGVVNYFRKSSQDCIVRLVNRLDRDTSGLVMIAKSQFAHQQMANKLDSNLVEKYYVALVEGKMEGEGTIDMPIGRPSPDSIKREVIENGQHAVTHYEVLKSSSDISYIRIKLETGRTHQIRVHLSHIGHPILGDTLYGRESEYINRQALHAFKLRFNRVRDDQLIEITADIPEDMKSVLEVIEKNSFK